MATLVLGSERPISAAPNDNTWCVGRLGHTAGTVLQSAEVTVRIFLRVLLAASCWWQGVLRPAD